MKRFATSLSILVFTLGASAVLYSAEIPQAEEPLVCDYSGWSACQERGIKMLNKCLERTRSQGKTIPNDEYLKIQTTCYNKFHFFLKMCDRTYWSDWDYCWDWYFSSE